MLELGKVWGRRRPDIPSTEVSIGQSAMLRWHLVTASLVPGLLVPIPLGVHVAIASDPCPGDFWAVRGCEEMVMWCSRSRKG
jgi:hypothetical protein